jgi:hypothetical protein
MNRLAKDQPSKRFQSLLLLTTKATRSKQARAIKTPYSKTIDQWSH